jgi:hypothetical protein
MNKYICDFIDQSKFDLYLLQAKEKAGDIQLINK